MSARGHERRFREALARPSSFKGLSASFSLDTNVSPPDKWRCAESLWFTHLLASKRHQHGTSGWFTYGVKSAGWIHSHLNWRASWN